jgi:hypothetical protein
MDESDKLEDPRRRLLVAALGAGLFGAGLGSRTASAQGVLGGTPGKLPDGQSIYRIQGSARVNGTPANLRVAIKPGDTVETSPNSEIIFAVGSQAMILRGSSQVVLEPVKNEPNSLFLSALRLVTGKLLSVSRGNRMNVITPAATIGIRGTGWYAESEPDQTYFCTCYGTTDIAANNDPSSRETVAAVQHDRPLYILTKAASGRSIRGAPFINHTDQELALIEALVGRTPPFVFSKDDYTGPRRDY